RERSLRVKISKFQNTDLFKKDASFKLIYAGLPMSKTPVLPSVPEDSALEKNIVLIIATPLCVTCLCVFIAGLLLYKRRKRTQFGTNRLERWNQHRELKRQPSIQYDRWEIKHSRLLFGEILGRGAFGQVSKGVIHGRVLQHQDATSNNPVTRTMSSNLTVAIKMLHGWYIAVIFGK
ncbi:unnamed protein product, partial [Owenia fusiformis]